MSDEILNIFCQSAAFNLRFASGFEGFQQRNILDNGTGEYNFNILKYNFSPFFFVNNLTSIYFECGS